MDIIFTGIISGILCFCLGVGMCQQSSHEEAIKQHAGKWTIDSKSGKNKFIYECEEQQ